MKNIVHIKKHHILLVIKSIFWFSTGAILASFFLASFAFILFQRFYWNTVYPGVSINGVDFGGKTKSQVAEYFSKKNESIKNSMFMFSIDNGIASLSAKQLNLGFDSNLLSDQAFSIGRSSSLFSNMTLVFQSYFAGIHLSPAYYYNEDALVYALSPVIQQTYKAPVDAVFTMQNNKVTKFQPSTDGRSVDIDALKQRVFAYVPALTIQAKPQTIPIPIPIKDIKPKITTEESNNYGIKELIGTGESWFYHSIPERIFNVTLAASRINGVLIAPNEVFSFDNALGDVSSFTGYKQAYVITNGKTVLGDGGGVCQVSTTFFRALLHAGVPILERHGHAYRVGYYEEGGFPPGIDATIYVPTVDLKFKNDTGHYIYAQTIIDPTDLKLTVNLYGTKDGRIAVVSKPIISNQTPAPDPLYQDDPTLPKGQIKQIDFAAPGAHISFTRTVIKDGKTMLADTFVTDYTPWRAVYLRGTKDQ